MDRIPSEALASRRSHSGSRQLLQCGRRFARRAYVELEELGAEAGTTRCRPVMDGFCAPPLMLPRERQKLWRNKHLNPAKQDTSLAGLGAKCEDHSLPRRPLQWTTSEHRKYTPATFLPPSSGWNIEGIKQLLGILGLYQKEQMRPTVWAVSCHSSMSEVIHGHESHVTSVTLVPKAGVDSH